MVVDQPLFSFSDEDIKNSQPAMKVGLIATVTPEGLPHVTLISSIMACGPKQLCFGQFTEGMSKHNILSNKKMGFLIMSLDKDLWRGKCTYTHFAKDGKEYDFYNNIPMFRYNAYFGVHTVYYLDLVSHSGIKALPMNKIIFAAIQSMLVRTVGKKDNNKVVLNPWTRSFLDKLDNLKFLSYIRPDGYPVIIPAIQIQSLGANRVVFSTSVYTQELEAIPPGSELAVFGMALTMEDVLLRGKYEGIHKVAGMKVGSVHVDWIYNPMPPVPGQVYPPLNLSPVVDFQD